MDLHNKHASLNARTAIYRPAYETAVTMLPRVRDKELISEAENVLEKANEAAEKISPDDNGDIT